MEILSIIILILACILFGIMLIIWIITFILDLSTSKEEVEFYEKLADGIIKSEINKNNK